MSNKRVVLLGFKPLGPSILAGDSPVKVKLFDTDAQHPLLSMYNSNETDLRAAVYRFLAKQKRRLYPHFQSDGSVAVCQSPNGFAEIATYLFWLVEDAPPSR